MELSCRPFAILMSTRRHKGMGKTSEKERENGKACPYKLPNANNNNNININIFTQKKKKKKMSICKSLRASAYASYF